MWFSMCRHLVPGTFLASIISNTTSLQSNTLYNSPQIRFDWPFANKSSFINLFDYGGAQALAFDALKILPNLKIRDSR